MALTRPRDRLYIAGFEGVKGREPGCWYDLIGDTLDDQLEETLDASGRTVWCIEAPQEAVAAGKQGTAVTAVDGVPPPDWARRPAPREPGRVVPLVPSQIAPLETDAEGEPVERPRERSLRRPLCFAARAHGRESLSARHADARLARHLPGRDAVDWEQMAHRFVDARGADLMPRTRASIVAETLAVLRDPAFRRSFGPASRAEVPIVAEIAPPKGVGETLRVTGQIDRLVRRGKEVLDRRLQDQPAAAACVGCGG